MSGTDSNAWPRWRQEPQAAVGFTIRNKPQLGTRMSDSPTVNAVAQYRCTASAGRIFDAWLLPQYITQWFGPGLGPMTEVRVDARVGGRFSSPRRGSACWQPWMPRSQRETVRRLHCAASVGGMKRLLKLSALYFAMVFRAGFVPGPCRARRAATSFLQHVLSRRIVDWRMRNRTQRLRRRHGRPGMVLHPAHPMRAP